MVRPQPDQHFQTVLSQIRVSSSDIASAKEFIRGKGGGDIQNLAAEFIIHRGVSANLAVEVYLGPTEDDVPKPLQEASRAISLSIACRRAAFELVASGEFSASGEIHWSPGIKIGYLLAGGRNTQGGRHRHLDGISFFHPAKLRPWPEAIHGARPSRGPTRRLPEGVDRALREARRCQLAGMPLPCLVMLGAAMEAMWTFAGDNLVDRAPEHETKATASRALEAFNLELKLLAIKNLCTETDVLGIILSGEKLKRLRKDIQATYTWANSLRLERNVIHEVGTLPSGQRLDDSAATLLLVAPFHLDFLARIAGMPPIMSDEGC